jgi:hypothetical protein
LSILDSNHVNLTVAMNVTELNMTFGCIIPACVYSDVFYIELYQHNRL